MINEQKELTMVIIIYMCNNTKGIAIVFRIQSLSILSNLSHEKIPLSDLGRFHHVVLV